MKAHYQMTLVDISADMLAVSQKLNPECEHIQGDMRSVRLERLFYAVIIHDAICYMTSEEDLMMALLTACQHCRPGGVGLFVPDHTREAFKPSTTQGGEVDKESGLRYLEWTFDPDPVDSTYVTYMTYMLREGKADVRCVFDCHLLVLFSQTDWLRLITRAGFMANSLPVERSKDDTSTAPVLRGIKPRIDSSTS